MTIVAYCYSPPMSALLGRSIRTLAWLGDAEFEREVRLRIAARGDFPTERLDTIKARIVRAESQAALLAAFADEPDESEQAVVRRARNAEPGGRGPRDTRAYRAATGLEALVAHWLLGGDRARFEAILGVRLEAAIDDAFAAARARPRRG